MKTKGLVGLTTLSLFLLLPLNHAASGDACPTSPDQTSQLAHLEAQLKAASSEMVARDINQQMWAIWTTAPDAKAQEMVTSGMAKRRVADYAGALEEFDALVDYCPDYAEGYNQRAFIHYLREDFEKALTDLEEALARNDRHTGALSGLALTLMALGEQERAQVILKKAVRINPWLPERSLLITPPRDRGL